MPAIMTPQFGNTYCPQLRMEVAEQSVTNASVTYAWSLYYVAHGLAASTGGVSKAYWVSFNAQVVSSGYFNINGIGGTAGITNGTFTVAREKSDVNVGFGCSMDFNITWAGVYGGNKATNGVVTVPRKPSWTISFNANGGTGAPGSMTKWYGENITIPSNIPSRTGYVFKGWGYSASSATVNYNPGVLYGEDGDRTLYAVWQAITYTVAYNANGGSGAPGNQIKTYGKNLTLSTVKPTRTNYRFVGWGTSAFSTTVSYQPGSVYTSNSSIILYAIWSLAYTAPRITNLVIDRCNSDGALSEEGRYARVDFNWSTDYSVTSILIQWRINSSASWTNSVKVSASGTSGRVEQVIGGNALNVELTYDVQITVQDANSANYAQGTVPPMFFIMDFLSGGKGIAFGKPAELTNWADFGIHTWFQQSVYIGSNQKIRLFEDSEGGNICIISHNNATWQIDAYNENLRIFRQSGIVSGSVTDGITIQTNGSVIVYSLVISNGNSPVMHWYSNGTRRGYIGYSSSGDTSMYISNEQGSNVVLSRNNLLFQNGVGLRMRNKAGSYVHAMSIGSDNVLNIGSVDNGSLENTALFGGYMVTIWPNRSYNSDGGNFQFFREKSGSLRYIFRPSANNGGYIGTNQCRWNTAFFTNSITASDLKEKDVIDDFDFKIDNFIMGLKPIAYRRTGDGDSGVRIHMGFGAQDVDRLIRSIGLGDMSITNACIVKQEEVVTLNDDGDEMTIVERNEEPYDGTQEVDDEALVWGLNYNEFIAPIVLMLQKQQTEIAELQREIYLLKRKEPAI